MDYKVEVKGKTKIYNANLLNQYFKGDEDTAGVAVDVDSYMLGVAVLDVDKEDLDNANLLELWHLPGKISDSESLTCQQRQDIRALVQEYTYICIERPGIMRMEQHFIKKIMKDPIKVKSYSVPLLVMLEADIIEPSKSAYCSLVVIVTKKDGSSRFSIDFRKLNLTSSTHSQWGTPMTSWQS